MSLDIEDGGASMIKLHDQQTLFNLKWLKRTVFTKKSLLNSTGISDIYLSWYGKDDYFLDFSCTIDNFIFPFYYSRFWKDVLSCYLRHKEDITGCNKNSETNYSTHVPLFFNKNVTYKNKVLFFRTWISAGIKYLNQIMNGQSIKPYSEIRELTGASANLIFEYNALRNSSIMNKPNLVNVSTGQNYTKLVKMQVSRFFALNNKKQRKLISGAQNISMCGKNFWSNHLKKDVFLLYSSTISKIKETKMKALLFKIFHNIFPTKILLNKYKIKSSNKCICGEIDYIDHYFINCPLIKDYWRGVKNYILSLTNFNIPESTPCRLFGLDISDRNINLQPETINLINYVLLIAKSAISKAKYYNSTNYTMYFENELSLRNKMVKMPYEIYNSNESFETD